MTLLFIHRFSSVYFCKLIIHLLYTILSRVWMSVLQSILVCKSFVNQFNSHMLCFKFFCSFSIEPCNFLCFSRMRSDQISGWVGFGSLFAQLTVIWRLMLDLRDQIAQGYVRNYMQSCHDPNYLISLLELCSH